MYVIVVKMSECMQQFEVWDSAREKSQSVQASTLNDLIMEGKLLIFVLIT